jgi:hypothetical protein
MIDAASSALGLAAAWFEHLVGASPGRGTSQSSPSQSQQSSDTPRDPTDDFSTIYKTCWGPCEDSTTLPVVNP